MPALEVCRLVFVRRPKNDPSSNDILVFSKHGLEEKEDRDLSNALATEQMKQDELISLDLDDTSSYIQKLPAKTIEPELIVEFETRVKYVLLYENGVFQWYFDNKNIDRSAGLPTDPLIYHHGFFSEDLVPITARTIRNIVALYKATGVGTVCKYQLPHSHYKIHIYLKLDTTMQGPSGTGTNFMMLTVCEHTPLKDIFHRVGGKAATKDGYLLRSFSWGESQSGSTQSILMTGTPFSYGAVKDADIAINKCGWTPDDGIVWLYPCKLTKGQDSRC